VGGIHQFVPMLHVGDAVGRHTLALQASVRAGGVESQIFVERDDPDTSALTVAARHYPEVATAGDLLVYQFATESALVPWLVARSEPLVVNYHNVTPPELFAPWDNALARAQLRAQGQLRLLARRALLGVAVSEFNRADLVAAGLGPTVTVPPIMDPLPRQAGRVPEPAAGVARPRAGARWLVVGRLAPNKAVEAAVDALFVHRRRFDPEATLTVVGKPALAGYAAALADHVAALGLAHAVRFAGRVDDAGLAEEYGRADVLVVTSEHEGFCLPVVEAMAYGVPVVAYRQGALPEVLADAGVLVAGKDPFDLARAAHRVCADPGRAADLVDRGRRRLAELHLDDAGERLGTLLRALQADGPRVLERLGTRST
jgi:glycosyltransferase involved in cell wall biosynthesis